jgi:hypothetical protein
LFSHKFCYQADEIPFGREADFLMPEKLDPWRILVHLKVDWRQPVFLYAFSELPLVIPEQL